MLLRLFKQRIAVRLFIACILISLVPLFSYSLISYRLSANTVRSDYMQYMTNLAAQILRNMDENMLLLQKQSSAFFLVRNDISYMLTANERDDIDHHFEVRARLDQYFLSHMQMNARLNGLALIDAEGEIKYANNVQSKNTLLVSVKDEPWFQQTLALQGAPYIRGPHTNTYIFNDAMTSVLSVSQSIIDYSTGKPLGVLVVDQNAELFFSDAANVQLEQEEQIVIVSDTGNVIYAKNRMSEQAKQQLMTAFNDGNESSSIHYEGRRYLMLSSPSSAYGFRAVSLLPESELKKKTSFMRTIPAIMLFAIAGLGLVFSLFFSYLIVQPLRRLMSSFKKLETGNFNVRVPVHGSHELALISAAFNKMVENMEALIKEKYEANLLRQQAEFGALQSQINPHFLYNTLSATRRVIDKHDFREASNMIDSLAGIFRYSLNPGEPVVALQEELDHVRQYLYLFETRFPGKIQAFFDIDDSLRECCILRLTLQPIVENAIKHGLHSRGAGGEIRIAARPDGEHWRLYVHDNGCGIAPDALVQLQAELQGEQDPLGSGFHSGREQRAQQAEAAGTAGPSATMKFAGGAHPGPGCLPSRHIGVRNVHYRIRLHFGEPYGLTITSKQHAYTTVKMNFPIQKHGKEREL